MAGLNLSDFDFSGVQTSGASQGDGGKLATAWQSVRSNSPDYTGIMGTGVATRANLRSAATQADADVYSSELLADAQIEAAKKAS